MLAFSADVTEDELHLPQQKAAHNLRYAIPAVCLCDWRSCMRASAIGYWDARVDSGVRASPDITGWS